MKKIMFNDRYGLTRAVLEGRKTQTRRICKHQYWSFSERVDANSNHYFPGIKMPFKEGEVVAVAQSYKDCLSASWIKYIHAVESTVSYDRELSLSPGQNNKMFVCARLMPHRIKFTNVRVEHLQDISEEDCLKEGIRRKNERYVVENEKGVCFYTNDVRLAFRCLIDKTCGKGTWESNPWVFVYDFELVK